MKKLFQITISVVVVFAFVSCEFFDDERTYQDSYEETTAIEGLRQEIKDQIVAQDSLMQDLVNKVDTLATALNESQKGFLDLKDVVDSLQTPRSTWGWMSISAIALALIALIISIVKSRGLNREDVEEIFRQLYAEKQNETIRIQSFQQKNNGVTQQHANTIQRIDSRLNDLEHKIQRLDVGPKTMPPTRDVGTKKATHGTALPKTTDNIQSEETDKTPANVRHGYARINTDCYFTYIFDSNQEECVFSIQFMSEQKGEFTIISLDKIKSRNGWQKVVEISGASIEDANTFKEEEKGICEKMVENGEDTWKVTKPLKIQLIK